jgi:predicted short-subunit dehydrogenase-like oxidoreductase (DUF2520 family)
MRFSIIGSGNVATQLGIFLTKQNEAVQVFSKTLSNAKLLANKLDASVPESIKDLVEVDLLIIAISDDQIEEVSEAIELIATNIVHTSGTKSIDLLNRHAKYGLLYPLQTFTKDRLVQFDQVPVFIEGNNKDAYNNIESIANANFKLVKSISFEQRQKLHVGAVVVNNFVNHLLAKTDDYLKVADMDMTYLMPLIQETIAKVHSFPAKGIQTGPAARGDQSTIDKHIDLIDDAALKEIYKVITNSILNFTN